MTVVRLNRIKMLIMGLRAFVSALAVIIGLGVASCQPAAVKPTATPDLEAIQMEERQNFPQVTQVEHWDLQSVISNPENYAPGIVPLIDGGYRIYWNDRVNGGIGSATSSDGFTFNVDAGLRLADAASGQIDCLVSNPWVIQLSNGYRMFYRGQENPCDRTVEQEADFYRILSAYSPDGRVFQRESGVRINIGPTTGLSSAATGRTLQLDDGSFRMFFTASLVNENNVVILRADSDDSLNWNIDLTPIVRDARSPTAIQIDDTIFLYVKYMTDNYLKLESTDGGLTFTPVSWLEFYDADNQRIPGFIWGDVFDLPSGEYVIYGPSEAGVAIFEQEVEESS